MTVVLHCKWCDVAIRPEEVIVGRPPGRPVKLMLDVDPHPDGRVAELKDGTYRMLSLNDRDPASIAHRPVFRVHGARSCSPDADRPNRMP